MKHYAILFQIVFLASAASGQTELDRRNGFKDIKMVTPIDSIRGATFKKDIESTESQFLKLYEIKHPAYSNIGDVPVDQVEVVTYKGLVYEITVLTEKDPRLMRGMELALGRADFNVRDKTYSWGGKNLSLTFSPFGKDQIQLKYHSHLITEMMKKDKEEKIEEIAEDF